MAEDWLETPYSLQNKRVYVAGHRGLVGSAMIRRLQQENCEILTNDLDLRRQAEVEIWFQRYRPDVVVLAAAKVGGIGANIETPANFIYDNLAIETNVIHAAKEARVEKLLFLGSSCIYPKEATLPITEDALLSGALEPSNQAYAVAKIAGIQMCQSYRTQYGCDFIAAMPCNLYGPGDRFQEASSHVIPALIMKAMVATDEFVVWGTGKPLREFLYVDDAVDALVFLLKNYSSARIVNVGSGQEVSIAGLARAVAQVCGFRGEIIFDASKPDGVIRKVMDSSRIFAAGWSPKILLEEGLRRTHHWYVSSQEVLSGQHYISRQK